MAKKKTAETAPVAEIKAEAVTKAVKEPAAEKAPAKKSAARTAAPKETVKIQFCGDEYDVADIKKAVETDCKSKYTGTVKTVEIYVKPADKAAYYVINSDFCDKIEL